MGLGELGPSPRFRSRPPLDVGPGDGLCLPTFTPRFRPGSVDGPVEAGFGIEPAVVEPPTGTVAAPIGSLIELPEPGCVLGG